MTSWLLPASVRVAVVGLTAFLCAAAVVGQAPPPPLQQPLGTGLIVGQVVDAESGRPVGDSIVTLTGNSAAQSANPVLAMATARKVITDSNGRFAYRDLAKGPYSITVMKPGYVAGTYGKLVPRGPGGSLDLAEGGRVTDVRILVWKHAAITGRVVDEAGEAVVAAEIRVQRVTTVAGRAGFAPTFNGTVTTDDRGVYRIPALEPGSYVVGVAATSTTIPAAMVEDYFRATGAARTEMQQALFGAAPSMSSPGSASNQVIGDHILQVQGRMPTPSEPADDGTLAVYTAVFYPQATRMADAAVITVKSGETRAGVDMQLRALPSARISGRLQGPDGPVGIATLYLMANRGGEPDGTITDAAATTVADGSGAFTFLGVPVGQYTLFAIKQPVSTAQSVQSTVIQGPGGTAARGVIGEGGDAILKPGYWAQQAVAVTAKSTGDVTVMMRTGLRVAGKAVFEGSTPFPAQQRISPVLEPVASWLRGFPLGETTLSGDGTFTLPGVPAGRYILTLPLPSGWYVKSATGSGHDLVELPFQLSDFISDVVVTISNRGARISGTVLDRELKADPAAGVMVFPVDSRQWVDLSAYPRRIRETRTGRDGAFTLADFPAGDYFIVAAPQASIDWTVPGLFERLSRVATRISLAEGDRKTVDLRTAQVR